MGGEAGEPREERERISSWAGLSQADKAGATPTPSTWSPSAPTLCASSCPAETLTTTIQDSYPKLMKRMRVPLTLGLCLFLFLLGLVCVTQVGCEASPTPSQRRG